MLKQLNRINVLVVKIRGPLTQSSLFFPITREKNRNTETQSVVIQALTNLHGFSFVCQRKRPQAENLNILTKLGHVSSTDLTPVLTG